MSQNRATRRANAAIKRRQVKTQNIKINAINPTDRGEAVLYEKTLTHWLYGEIPVMLTGGFQEDIQRYAAMLAAQRRIPLDYSAGALPLSDRVLQFYLQQEYPMDHARDMAAAAWHQEYLAAQNHANILALFTNVQFEGDPPAQSTQWESAEETAKFGLPPRPTRFIKAEPERKLSFVFNLIETGYPDSDESDDPSFEAQILISIAEAARSMQDMVDSLLTGEPVDEDGFRGEYVDGDAPASDDAVGEAEG